MTILFIFVLIQCQNQKKIIIDKELEKLVKMGVLEQGLAQCSSPVMLVAKKGTSAKRVVSDLRFLNTKILKQNWPFPLVRDTVQKLGSSGCSEISTLDLKDAFYSLHLDAQSQQKTGITSYYGGKSYFYKRLPMGSSTSPSEFQFLLEQVIDTIPNARNFVIAHMDDLIIFSKDVQEHMSHIASLLQALGDHGLKLSPKKAMFCRNEIIYMGHKISIIDGRPHISAMVDKCQAIRKLGIPRNCKEVKTFVGAVTYLSDYIPNLQKLLQPMHKISNKNHTFIWSVECNANFERVKELLCNPPVLAMPQQTGLFILYSDTSRTGTGAKLCQMVDGKERLIGFNSRCLLPAAMNYSVSELEYHGLQIHIQNFRNILKSVHFKALVDHSSLVDIQKSKRELPTLRFRKYVERLSDYSFDLGYIPGSEMGISDMLSRMCQGPDVVDSEPNVPIACLGNVNALVTTRAQAKSEGTILGDPNEYGVQPATRGLRAPEEAISQPEAVSTDWQTRPIIPIPAAEPVPILPYVEPQRGESHSLVEHHDRVTKGVNRPEVPVNTLIPRNDISHGVEDADEMYDPCPEELTRDTAPVFSHLKPAEIRITHLPKYHEVKKHLEQIKQKCLRDFNVPLKTAEIKREYPKSVYFGGYL